MKRFFGLLFIYLFLFAQPVLARSGCCSHHDGVRADGCGCNDGSPLSSTCAPYYVCSSSAQQQAPSQIIPTQVQNTSIPTKIIIPTTTPTQAPTSTSIPTPNLTPVPEVKGAVTTITTTPAPVDVAGTASSGDTIGGLITLGVFGGLGYFIWKKIKGKFKNQNLPQV